MLPQVLTQIGQQQPELLQEINANQALFLQMMNEPVTETSSSPAPPAGGSPQRSGGMSASMMDGMGNPAQMAQMLQNMSPNELQQMANMMGLTPEQLQATARMIGQIPPDQLQEYMMQAMQAGGMPGGGMGGPQVLRLTEEEMAAVDRLTEMGFDRTEAAQAFLACDKNEALAANLLMDSAGQEGGAFGFPPDDDNNGGDDDDGDDMYD
jgi:UV excision repair protein RAD23